ncbi:choline dehydrogenase-like flavoprotein [Streptomyces sp. 2333.5]|uniref:GMC oxidoreductase n=1 Tax=unclassified Streptomyces TaxID=2593676 RepID=UPI00089BC4F7|nr:MULTISPECIES: GMC oxidoreductase [unclassified Streptomyces]PJJ05053.1 choline dehydrogenase-like flavoprotein [Streptomyces sp. 2333.5]SEE66997.1 Choline dehydrogenase [Streptomyces sp. 2314.4]SEE93266.1 Choline dehydrogenase [Streptomyces sp. 2112.2]
MSARPDSPGSPRLESYCFSTLADVVHGSFDHLVVGGGLVGTVMASELLARNPEARVLVLEQGPFLLPDHVQNLPSTYHSLINRAQASPWRVDGDLSLAPQVPYVGGRALFWSTWTPQPRPEHLRDWPDEVVAGLEEEWEAARELLGVRSGAFCGSEATCLYRQAGERLFQGIGTIADLSVPDAPQGLDASLAAGPGASSAGYRRFSPVPMLLDLLRRYPERLTVVTECEVLRLYEENGRATAAATTQGTLHGLEDAAVVLAHGTVETTKVVLSSFPGSRIPLAGRNLNGHVGTWFTCRVPRAAFPALPSSYQAAAFYLDGGTKTRQFHVDINASATSDSARDVEDIYRLVPDIFRADALQQLCDDEHVVLFMHGIGEVAGERGPQAPGRVRLDDAGETVVTTHLDAEDVRMWDAMDDAMTELVGTLAQGAPVEFWSPSERRWTPKGPVEHRQTFLMHECGTLWMGHDPAESVTDLTGRLHAVDNVYLSTAAVFPTGGSWNPTLTMVAMARRLARHLSRRA